MSTIKRIAELKRFLLTRGEIGGAILAKDWSKTSIGPLEAWPVSLIATLRMTLTTRQAIVFFWGPDLLQFFNETYAPTVIGMAANPVGAPFKEYWAEVYQGVRPYYERAIAGEGTWEEDLPLRLTRNGVTEDTYWTFSYSPLYGDDGAVAGFLNVVNDTTGAVRDRHALGQAQQDLAAEREQLRLIVDGAREYAVIATGPDRQISAFSRGAEEIFGRTEAEMIGQPIDEIFSPEDRAAGIPGLELAVAETEGVASDVRWHERPDGRRVFMDGTVRPLSRDAKGRAQGFMKIARNATAEKLAADRQAALLALGDRLRGAVTTVEIAEIAAEILGQTLHVQRAGLAHVDMRLDRFEIEKDWTTGDMQSLAGKHSLSAFDATLGKVSKGETLAVANIAATSWLDNDAASYRRIGTRAQIKIPLMGNDGLFALLYAHSATPRAWSKQEVDFAHGVADRIHSALGKVQAEEQRAVLNQELSHRLKNTLAMVQAIATQTLRSVPGREPVEAFERRLHALGAAHDVLLQESWSSADMETAVRKVLGIVDQDKRFTIFGPPVQFGPRSTLSLSLLMHELATNAVKYGALGHEDGTVKVTWRIERGGGEPELVLDWREKDGPLVDEPSRNGFGSRLIRMGLVGTGGVELHYLQSGLHAEMRAPLSQVQQS